MRLLAGGLLMSDLEPSFHHEPVMVDRVVELFRSVPAGVVIDATVGGGGHAAAILAAHEHLRIVGIDRDRDALVAAGQALAPFGDRAMSRHGRFDDLRPALVAARGFDVVGVLFDLGVSSPQLDRADRGFSYRFDAPLDMRMDRSSGITAADVVNGYAESRLARILAVNGDERFASRIARAIVASRPLATTAELAETVRSAIPAPARRRGGHPAKRTFQAIRIEVNVELAILPGAIDRAIASLAEGGRIVVLAYHSGEDRIVKDRLRTAANGGCTCPPGLPCVCGAQPTLRLLKQGAWKPAADELAANPRAESARMRAAEKLGAA